MYLSSLVASALSVNCKYCGANIDLLTEEEKADLKRMGLSLEGLEDFENTCLRCMG